MSFQMTATASNPAAVTRARFSNISICNKYIYYYRNYVLLLIIFIIY